MLSGPLGPLSENNLHDDVTIRGRHGRRDLKINGIASLCADVAALLNETTLQAGLPACSADYSAH